MLFLFAFLLLNPAIESVEVKLNTQDFINELVPEKQTQCANLLVMASLTNLYIFSKDGSLLQTLGGAGNGPGQFQRIGIVNRVHDSNSQPAIAVTDSRRLDITFYRYAGEGSGFTYVGRFNKAVRNIFPIQNGFAASDISAIAQSGFSPEGENVMSAHPLSFDGERISWAHGVSFYEFDPLMVEIDYALTAHFFLETHSEYLAGFKLEPKLRRFSKTGKQISEQALNLYRFVRIDPRAEIKDPYSWHAAFSEIHAVMSIKDSQFFYYSAPKLGAWELVRARVTGSPGIANHDYFIQQQAEGKKPTIFRVPAGEWVLDLHENQGSYYVETLSLDDSGFNPVYIYRMREAKFESP